MSKQPESETSPRFQCPACGASFEVASWYSSRIYCSRKCRALLPADSQEGKT